MLNKNSLGLSKKGAAQYSRTRYTHSVNASCSYKVQEDIICIHIRAGRYTAEKPKRRYFCHTGIDIEQKILYRQTDIP